MKIVFGISIILLMVADSLGCGCKVSKFKLAPCSKKNSFTVQCSSPVFNSDCSLGSANCTTNNKLGAITSAELTVDGFVNMLPMAVKVARACEPNQGKSKGESVASMIENNLAKICEDIKNENVYIEVPISEENKTMLKTLVGTHKFTVKAKKINGDPKNEMCIKVEAMLSC